MSFLSKDIVSIISEHLDPDDILNLMEIFPQYEHTLLISMAKTFGFITLNDLNTLLRSDKKQYVKYFRKLMGIDINDIDIIKECPNLTDLVLCQSICDSENPVNVDNLIFPNSLTYLEFNLEFNEFIKPGLLPNSLIHLIFGDYFDQPIVKGVLPKSLKYLEFGDNFDKPIVRESLPESLRFLRFGKYFASDIDEGALPDSLVNLSFGKYYNQPIKEGILPNSLKRLTFGKHFDSEIKCSLPNSLTHLTIAKAERLVLPDSLIKLTISHYPNVIKIDSLPKSLKLIRLLE